MDRKKISSVILQGAIFVVAIAVFGQNMLLLRDNRSLRQMVNRVNAETTIPIGKTIRNISGSSIDGKLHTISMPEQPTDKLLIITFSAGCPYCRASQASWMALSKELRERPGWRVLWVSRDPIKNAAEYSAKQQIPADEVIADPTYRTYMALSLKAVPSTVVVGAGGHVEKVWTGRLDKKEAWSDVATYLNLRQKELPSAPEEKDLAATLKY
jgi:peroxiredoxin